jgi:selenocysteine lyase/cysteine desulfurase
VSFLWLRSSLLDRVAVALPGWRSPSDMWEFLDYEQGYARTASRYEGGTPNVIGALSLATSMDVLEEAGLDRIAAHVVALTDRVAEGAAARGYAVLGDRSRDDVKSGIVTISKEGVDPIALGRRLGEAGVNVTYRANGIRISPHGHNSFDDIDALLSAL